ncbi:MAG: hypothetical protein LUD72_11290 [Bacteroidales bacterium]|nr:hypothetical protein [Bacteroidales bacterium]
MTILTIALLIVADVLAIVSLIWNIRSVRRAEYALKKINKRVKGLEESDKTEDDDDIQMDPESDPEAQEEDSGALPDETEGDL